MPTINKVCMPRLFPALRASVSIQPASKGPSGDLSGPPITCLVVDVQARRAAPDNELIRIDYGSNDDLAGALCTALDSLSILLPSVMRGGQLVRILHDFENARIVVTPVPRDGDSLDLPLHGGPPKPDLTTQADKGSPLDFVRQVFGEEGVAAFLSTNYNLPKAVVDPADTSNGAEQRKTEASEQNRQNILMQYEVIRRTLSTALPELAANLYPQP